mmetsp:Transcript_820/g.2794  ORF Transcript_820/g.2794 Transcript_820/m.2794 type:complete len:363 (-) Transcript_820:54-1142(-)
MMRGQSHETVHRNMQARRPNTGASKQAACLHAVSGPRSQNRWFFTSRAKHSACAVLVRGVDHAVDGPDDAREADNRHSQHHPPVNDHEEQEGVGAVHRETPIHGHSRNHGQKQHGIGDDGHETQEQEDVVGDAATWGLRGLPDPEADAHARCDREEEAVHSHCLAGVPVRHKLQTARALTDGLRLGDGLRFGVVVLVALRSGRADHRRLHEMGWRLLRRRRRDLSLLPHVLSCLPQGQQLLEGKAGAHATEEEDGERYVQGGPCCLHHAVLRLLLGLAPARSSPDTIAWLVTLPVHLDVPVRARPAHAACGDAARVETVKDERGALKLAVATLPRRGWRRKGRQEGPRNGRGETAAHAAGGP